MLMKNMPYATQVPCQSAARQFAGFCKCRTRQVLPTLQQMPGFFGLGPQIGPVVFIVGKSMPDASGNLHPGRFEAGNLVGIVGEQTYRSIAEQPKHACGDSVESFIRFEAQTLVRVDRVEALILQAIGAQLVDEADASAFLCKVQKYSP